MFDFIAKIFGNVKIFFAGIVLCEMPAFTRLEQHQKILLRYYQKRKQKFLEGGRETFVVEDRRTMSVARKILREETLLTFFEDQCRWQLRQCQSNLPIIFFLGDRPFTAVNLAKFIKLLQSWQLTITFLWGIENDFCQKIAKMCILLFLRGARA